MHDPITTYRATMASFTTNPRADRQLPVKVPRLSYRNSLNVNPSLLHNAHESQVETVQDEREAYPIAETSSTQSGEMLGHSSRKSFSTTTILPTPPTIQQSPTLANPKKKGSIFGGKLFVKEASSAALEQFASQLIAQHGELNAKAIPGVSSAKMPKNVPKVNRKWEPAKAKPQEDKDRGRTIQSLTTKAQIPRQENKQSAYSPERFSSNSTLSSFDSRGATGEKNQSKIESARKLVCCSVDSIGEIMSPSRDVVPKESQGPIGLAIESLPSSCLNLSNPSISIVPTSPPAVHQAFSSSWLERPRPTTRKLSNAFGDDVDAPELEAVPEQSSSTLTTPRDRSPVTPGVPDLKEDRVICENSADPRMSFQEDIPTPAIESFVSPRNERRKSQIPVGFLAGEAKPFEIPEEVDLVHRARYQPQSSSIPQWHKSLQTSSETTRRKDSKTSKARLAIREK